MHTHTQARIKDKYNNLIRSSQPYRDILCGRVREASNNSKLALLFKTFPTNPTRAFVGRLLLEFVGKRFES